jgi:hypothetical protein
MPSGHSLVLSASAEWLNEKIQVQAGGQIARWQATENLPAAATDNLVVPIRHLRVLYVLPNALYNKWCIEHTPTGYEYFCPYSSLNSFNSQKMRSFLKRMSIASQFYVIPGKA